MRSCEGAGARRNRQAEVDPAVTITSRHFVSLSLGVIFDGAP